MSKLLWNEYALKEAVKTIKAECALHSICKGCTLQDETDGECIFDKNAPEDINADKIYENKEY